MDKEGYSSLCVVLLGLLVVVIIAWYQDSKRKTQALERLIEQDTSQRVQDSLYKIWYYSPQPD